jgi:hypothetical protein
MSAEMSEATPPPGGEGAPVPRDAIDPELVRLRRPRPQIGALTALAIVVLCLWLAGRLDADRRFAGEPDAPRPVTVADLAAGRIDDDAHVAVSARVERGSAVRAQKSPASPGLRLVPVAGSADKVWIAVPGDGWTAPVVDGRYQGRVVPLDELPFAEPVRDYLARPHPRFVAGDALARARAASADGGALTTVTGDAVRATGDTRVEVEVADPGAATIVAAFNDRFPDAAAWTEALTRAVVIAPGSTGRDGGGGVVFDVRGPDAVAVATQSIEKAQLWGARVEPVTVRHLATWRELTPAGPSVGFPGGATLPWSAIDVAALWLPRTPPDGAVVVLLGEEPGRYWYVLPIYGAIALFGLLFAWALARAVKRDFLR